jgi:2-phosphosulfolactate phosphatase
MFYDQHDFDVRLEWGLQGVSVLAPISDVVIVVDILSFSTSVDIAVQRWAQVYPYRWKDERAAEFAASVHAELGDQQRTPGKISLSPQSLLELQPGSRIVLPSPNGATLALAAAAKPVLAGCFRNAQAVAQAARNYGPKIAVIPAGERWRGDQSLRPCFEDLTGAGAIISYLSGELSPEASSAAAAFQAVKSRLGEALAQCSSGKELIQRGFAEDVCLATQLNASDVAPTLIEGAFVRVDAEEQQ